MKIAKCASSQDGNFPVFLITATTNKNCQYLTRQMSAIKNSLQFCKNHSVAALAKIFSDRLQSNLP